MSRLGRAAAKVRDSCAQLGPWNAVLYAASRALERISGGRARIVKYYIVAQPVQASVPLRPDPKTVVRFTGPDDSVTSSFPRPRQVIERRYACGAQCLAATVGDQFAGFIWWQRERYDEDEVRCTYVLSHAERSVWDYDVYVEPRFRLGRTMARLWQTANQHLVHEGVVWSFSRISAFNPTSLSTHAKLGMRACHAATFCVFGRVQLAVFGVAPFVHVSLSPARRPVLRLAVPATRRP